MKKKQNQLKSDNYQHRDTRSANGEKRRAFSWPAAIFLVIALFIVLSPLLRPGFFVSDDGEWMIIRLSAFYQSLADGQFPVRFLGRLNNSYGYPVANFLYPGFLYIGSLIHLVGVSFSDTVKIILGASVAVASVAIYAALRTEYKLRSSILGAISFIFAPYLLYDLYHRGSVGEVLALGAAAVAVLAIVRGWVWLVAPAVGFLIVSHNTVAMIMMAAIISVIAVHQRRVSMYISALLGIGLASFFWVPALLEKRLVRFDMIEVSDPSAYFITLSNAGLLGFATIVALAVIIGIRHRFTVREKVITAWVVGGILMSLPLSLPLWNIRGFSSLIQFPYRLLVLPVLFAPWVIAIVSDKLSGWKMRIFMAILVMILASGAYVQLRLIQFVERSVGFYTTNEGTTNVADEYMPRWVQDVPIRRPVETLEVIDGDVDLSGRTFSGEKIMFIADAKEASVIQINKIYYPGWGVTIDNRLIPINYHNALGVMRIEVPSGRHTIAAAFRETPLRFAADMLSLISLVVYLVVVQRLQNKL